MGKPTVDLGLEVKEYGGGRDSLVVVKDNGDIPGGVTLDVREYRQAHPEQQILQAGHLIGRMAGEDTYFPLLAIDGTYKVSLSDSQTPLLSDCGIVGVLKRSVPLGKGDAIAASVLVSGVVNAAACPNSVELTIVFERHQDFRIYPDITLVNPALNHPL